MEENEQLDYPFDDVCKKAEELARLGHWVYQKFTCSGCGNRLTIDEHNKFYTRGTCDQCGAMTNIREKGCNMMIHMGLKLTK